MDFRAEQALVKGILDQDNETLKAFYKNNFHSIENLILSKGGTNEDAKDVFQDGMIALYLNLKNGKYTSMDGHGLEAYFMQICKFRWYDKVKKKANKEQSLEHMTVEPSEDAAGFDIVDEHYKIHELIQKLGDKCQTILRLFYWEKKDMVAIASYLNMESDSVKNAKYRCIMQLKKLAFDR
ncbi:MAG: sigma-70 family RNA polymerase sigma factor [Saprospiraceae bacterium]|nr:sigma-70 family RNA polymerase sigma factor [Saprospiraceae bacterium]